MLPVEHRLEVGGPMVGPPQAVACTVGDDIDGGVFVHDDDGATVAVRVVFVDDVDELEQEYPWIPAGELSVPSGHLVLADPYCTPRVPYRQQLDVRPGRWVVEELSDGDLEAVRLRWLRPMS